jgi:hypothetical protein
MVLVYTQSRIAGELALKVHGYLLSFLFVCVCVCGGGGVNMRLPVHLEE